jgi:multisubunit Na+/H+ antiporter MnhC subunit
MVILISNRFQFKLDYSDIYFFIVFILLIFELFLESRIKNKKIILSYDILTTTISLLTYFVAWFSLTIPIPSKPLLFDLFWAPLPFVLELDYAFFAMIISLIIIIVRISFVFVNKRQTKLTENLE